MKFGIVFFSFCLLFNFTLAFAQVLQNPCMDIKTIRTVKVPWDPSRPKSPKFEYSFKYELINPLAPTVVVIPGGPGQTSIIGGDKSVMGAIPANFNKLYTDPRSQGCNYVVESQVLVPYLKTEYVVNDIFLAIKSLNLKNYIIYGTSYGTVVATQLAKRLETEKWEAPVALVLEGTIGKKFDNFDSYFYFFQMEWEKASAKLPQSWKSYFQSGKIETAFTKQQWGSMITNDLIVGDVPDAPISGPLLNWHLHLLELYFAKKVPAKDQPFLPSLFSRLKESQFPNLFFRMIGCGELWGDWYFGRSLESNRLTRTGQNVCEGIDYKKPYDSADYLISVPIYYFQGPNDPAAPMYTALYHYEVQKKAVRQFLTVAGAGHAPLTSGLRSCADDLWSAISSQRTLGRELSGCQRQTSLTTRKAGQE